MRYKKLIGLTATLAIVGCTNNPVSDGGDDNGSNQKFQVSTSQSAKREVVAGTDSRITSLAKSDNEFAVKMYSELAKEDNTGKSNLFFSPFSIVSALGMADVGAAGETDKQVRAALQVQLPGDDFHAALNGLDQSLETFASTVENLQLKNVNSIWAQNGFPLKLLYLDRLTQHYGAGVNLLDFIVKPDSSRIIINDWVSEQTNNRINDLLPQGSINIETRVVLTNAIYFLADWLLKFDPSKTADKLFTRNDGQKVTVPMMVLRKVDEISGEEQRIKLLYSRVESTRILELPYRGNRLVMDFLLPDSGTFDNFESGLTTQRVDALVNGLDSAILPPVQIPRFEFTTGSVSLKKALTNLGMIAPFTSSADFSGISKNNLYIEDVIHKAFIKVDEKGTEAAAATGVIIATVSYPPPPPKYFIADRPFLYMIRDTQTKSILFMGRVLDPTVTK
jgi:serpin B